MSKNNMEPAFLDPDNNASETTSMVSFEAHLVGKEHHPASGAFIKRNRINLKRNIDCEEIILAQEPSNPVDSNAVKVMDASSGKTIGYLDKYSASILAKLKMKSLRGVVQSIDNDENTVIKVVIETLLSMEDARDIISGNARRFIARHYPDTFSNAAFGSEPPTLKQFLYALDLGIDPRKKTFTSISTAIEKAEEKGKSKKTFPVPQEHRELLYEAMCSNSPADRDQLKDIKDLHGELSRKITSSEADDVINYLEALNLECPYCHEMTMNGDICFMCGRNLRGMHIQVEIDPLQEDIAPASSRISVRAIIPPPATVSRGGINKKTPHNSPEHTEPVGKKGTDSAGCLSVLIFLLLPVLVVCILL